MQYVYSLFHSYLEIYRTVEVIKNPYYSLMVEFSCLVQAWPIRKSVIHDHEKCDGEKIDFSTHKYTQNPVKHQNGAYCKNSSQLFGVSYFCKTLHFTSLIGF